MSYCKQVPAWFASKSKYQFKCSFCKPSTLALFSLAAFDRPSNPMNLTTITLHLYHASLTGRTCPIECAKPGFVGGPAILPIELTLIEHHPHTSLQQHLHMWLLRFPQERSSQKTGWAPAHCLYFCLGFRSCIEVLQ